MISKSNMQCYIIQISVLNKNFFSPLLTLGENCYLDLEKHDKSDLFPITIQMWNSFLERTGLTPATVSFPITTISFLKDNKINILYSSKKTVLNKEEIGEPLDIVDFEPIHFQKDPGFNIFKDEVNFETFISQFD